MEQILLNIPQAIQRAVWKHLLPRRFIHEEAAFLYAKRKTEGKTEIFQYVDWFPVPVNGFLSCSPFYFELTDEMRAMAIKRAHDLQASIVELHSHKGIYPATFSPSDLLGFQEVVPHVWWRLKGRPYFAVVVSRSGFDGLTWISGPYCPQYLDGIITETSILKPTKLSQIKGGYYDK